MRNNMGHFMPCMPNICVTVGFKENNYNLIKIDMDMKIALNLRLI